MWLLALQRAVASAAPLAFAAAAWTLLLAPQSLLYLLPAAVR
jgi:hypothetical protein